VVCDSPLVKIASITRLANGHIFLQGAGLPNQTYTIQASPNLSPNSFDTIAIGATSANPNGSWQYDDAVASGLTKRFYHVLPGRYGVNLIVNGNAELGVSSSTGAPVVAPRSWCPGG